MAAADTFTQTIACSRLRATDTGPATYSVELSRSEALSLLGQIDRFLATPPPPPLPKVGDVVRIVKTRGVSGERSHCLIVGSLGTVQRIDRTFGTPLVVVEGVNSGVFYAGNAGRLVSQNLYLDEIEVLS